VQRILLLLLACAGLVCAGLQLSTNANSDVNIRVDTTLVLIPVTVTDASHRFVLGLDKKDFSISENGVPQKITQFSGEDAPLSVGVLVDTSGSMGSKIETSRQAVSEFLKTMNAQDEAFLLEFSDHAQVAVPFTQKPEEIETGLAGIQTQGLTALLDAVELGLREMKKSRNSRKALLIISDGGDNNSKYTAGQIANLVREADVQIYSMGVFEQFPLVVLTAAELSGPHLLAEISEQTGGRAFPARSFSALPLIARRIGIELRNQYVLAYSPSNRQRDGTFRKVQVAVTGPQGLSGLKARWRLGYYAPVK
jgi:Ca-activated chloride channel family protein